MNGLAGTPSLLRLAWRRDRIMILAALAVLFLLVYGSVAAVADLYPTVAAQEMANRASNASIAVVAMYGVIHDTAGPGIGVLKLQMIGFLLVVFLVIAIVRRHTRAEEEAGRFELLGGTVMGRRAPLAAAVALAACTSVAAGLLVTAGSVAGGWPAAGSVALGTATTAMGLAFTGLAAVGMQLSQNTRTCSTAVYSLVAVAFVLRMVGDVNDGRPLALFRWLSPLGWGQQVHALDHTRWWPLVLLLVLFVVTLVAADRLLAARDLDAGLLATTPGAERSRIGSPAGLAWRLTRGGVLGWLVGLALLAAIMGVVLESSRDFLTPEAEVFLRKMGGTGGINDLFVTMLGMIAGLALAAFGLSVVLRLRTEESGGRLEPVLATPATRADSFVPYIAIALAASALLAAVFGLVIALSHSVASGSGSRLWRDAQPVLVQIPAVWVVIGVAVVLTGWLPRWASMASWALFVAFVVVGELAPIFEAPEWVAKLSPFAHLPRVPVEAMDWASVAVLVAVAAALIALGLVGFRRRDLPVT